MEEVPKPVASPAGGRVREVLEKGVRLLARSYQRPYPLAVRKVVGAVVEDLNGNRYIDFTAGGGLLPLGGGHPSLREVYARASENPWSFSSNSSSSEPALELVEELERIAPIRGEVRALITDSGAEAVEAALRTARWHTGKPLLLGFTGSYHGSTLAAASLSTDSKASRRFTHFSSGVIHAPYPDCLRCPLGLSPDECGVRCLNYLEDVLEKAPGEEVAAVVLQPIRVDAASPPDGFSQRLKKLCKRAGALLCLDECISAPARSGRWFASEHLELDGEIVVLSSPLASGLPLGILLAREDILDLEPGMIRSEVGGNNLIFEAALATLHAIRDEGLVERAERLGRRLKRRLEGLAEELETVRSVRGKGMLLSVELTRDGNASPRLAREAVSEAFRLGLILGLRGPSVILSPALNIDESLMDKGLEVLEAAIREVAEA